MSVDLAKDIAYLPKVNFGYKASATAQFGYLAITEDSLFFVPESSAEEELESEQLTQIFELGGSLDDDDFWRVVPVLAQQLPAEQLAQVISKMAALIDGSIVISLSSIKAFKFGLMGVEVVHAGGTVTFSIGHAPKKTKRLKLFLKQHGLLTE